MAATTRLRGRRVAAVVAAATVAVGMGSTGVARAAPSPSPAKAAPAAADPSFGYWLVAGDGGVFSFGTSPGAPFFGSAASNPANCAPNTVDRNFPNGTCFAIADHDAAGYWILNGDRGRIFPFGGVGFFGQPADNFAGAPRDLLPTGVAMAATPSGHGYWVLEGGLSGAGIVAPFGDAGFFGDTQTILQQTGHAPNGSPVGLAVTPDGRGYWEVHSDGGVFSFGDAQFFGSMGNKRLNAPVVGMAATPDGRGYWLTAADGGVFAFGDAVFAGSAANFHLAGPVVGIAADLGGPGYWLVASDGGVFSFGGAPFLGSMGGKHLNRPIFGIAAFH